MKLEAAIIKPCLGTPELQGRVAVHFSIACNGTVLSPLVNKSESTLEDSKVHECIIAALRTWTFPAIEGDKDGVAAEVNYPFKFEP